MVTWCGNDVRTGLASATGALNGGLVLFCVVLRLTKTHPPIHSPAPTSNPRTTGIERSRRFTPLHHQPCSRSPFKSLSGRLPLILPGSLYLSLSFSACLSLSVSALCQTLFHFSFHNKDCPTIILHIILYIKDTRILCYTI